MKATFAFAVCTTLYGQQASIEGLTVDAITKAPLAGVHLRLVTGFSTGMTAYGAISDRDGRFFVATIRPGNYIMLPERNGYFYAQSRTDRSIPNVVVHAGEQLTGLRIEMSPRAILSGRVLDEFGDPLRGARVEAVAVSEAVSEKEALVIMMNSAPASFTDDRGSFRVATLQGRYYLQITVGENINNNRNERPEIRMDGSSAAPYSMTFYPSSIIKERATPVEAVGGKEISGLDIRLSRQKAISISGRVSGIPRDSRPGVMVQWGERAGQMTVSTSITADSDGRFTVANAHPGFYRIWADYQGNPQMASGFAEFQVDSSDVANVDLLLVPGAELSGAVDFEGDPPGSLAEKLTVRLEPALPGAYNPLRPTGGDTDERGTFRLEGVGGAGKFRVKVEPLPENAYIKKVQLDGWTADDAVVELKGGMRSSRFKITLSRNGGQLTGRVLDENGKRLSTVLVTVVLAPVPVAEPLSGETMAEIQPDGRYSFKGLRPGKYRVLALDMLRRAGPISEDIKLVEKGEEIEIKESDRIEKELRVLPKEDPNAKPKQ